LGSPRRSPWICRSISLVAPGGATGVWPGASARTCSVGTPRNPGLLAHESNKVGVVEGFPQPVHRLLDALMALSRVPRPEDVAKR